MRGSAVVALTSYFLFAFGFFANLILTRILAPADFGVFALGTFFFTLFNLRPKLGIDQAFARHNVTDGQTSGTYAALSGASAVASLIVALIAAPVLLALGYSESVVIVTLMLAGVGMLDSVTGIAWGHLDKALLFSRVSLVTAITFPLSYLPAFYLALQGYGYWALLAQNATYALLLLGGMWATARRVRPPLWERWSWSFALGKQFIKFGLYVGLAAIFAMIVYQFDNFLVGTIVGVDTLGYYDRAYRIAQWSYILVSGVLSRTIFYAYSRLRDDQERLTRTATMSLWIVTTLAVPIALAIFVTADDLVLFLFGPKWLPSALFLRFLVVYSVSRPLLDDAASLFIAVGYPRRTTLVTLFQAVALILAGTVLTLRAGAVGTAVGVGVAFGVGLMVTYYFVRRTLPRLSLRGAFLIPAVAAVAALALALLAVPKIHALGLPLVVSLSAEALLVMLVYSGIVFVLRPAVTVARTRYVWDLLHHRVSDSALEIHP